MRYIGKKANKNINKNKSNTCQKERKLNLMKAMKRKLWIRCLIGAPIGLAISTMDAIIISLLVGDGNFYAVVPKLITDCGTEINAVLLQAVCSLLYGAAWAGSFLIWEIEHWSLLRQTMTHLLVCSAATFPIAYFMYWMEHSVAGVVTYFSIFFGTYFAVWLWQYLAMKRRITQMNHVVQERNREN